MSDSEYPPRPTNTSLTPTRSPNEPMPHPLDAEWHVSVDQKTYGPFSGHDLRTMAAEGRMEYDALVQKVGGPEKWIQAADDRALSKFFYPGAETPATQCAHDLGWGQGAGCYSQ